MPVIARAARAAGLSAFVLLAAACERAPSTPAPVESLASGDVALHAARGTFVVRGDADGAEGTGGLREASDGAGARLLDRLVLAATLDDRDAHLVVARPTIAHRGDTETTARAELVVPGSAPIAARLVWSLLPASGGVRVRLAGEALAGHRVALRARLPYGASLPFVSGAGEITGETTLRGAAVAVGAGEHGVLALSSASHEPVGARLVDASGPLRAASLLEIESPVASEPALAVTLAATEADAIASARAASGEATRVVRGRVVGAGVPVRVLVSDEALRPIVRADAAPGGAFEAVLPRVPVVVHAIVGTMRGSDPVARALGDDAEAEVRVAPGGAALVRVRDRDTGAPLTARVIVQGVPPTADPSFGPDYLASGAGPLLDALRGEATLALPTGRYRVKATRGPEWSIDEHEIDVPPGAARHVDLALRHLIDSTGLVGCDLHVHARPSFDTPVSAEDRVLSLVAAGIDFAVPTEHNVVGNYAPALAATGLGSELASVPAVEITTVDPPRGHFNVYPFDDPEAPPYKQTSLKKIFARARNGHPERVLQVNHPRLEDRIGYFDVAGFDPKTGRWTTGEYVADYDALEVFNGVDGSRPEVVERVVGDWLQLLAHGRRYVATGSSDSHHIEFGWAGWPRTYVALAPEQAGDTGRPIDTAALVAAVKGGRAVVSSGLHLDVSIGDARPGDTARIDARAARLHVRVRAVPWIDATDVEVFVGTESVVRRPIAAKAAGAAAYEGDLAAARAATVRLDEDVDVPLPDRDTFVVVVARGDQWLDQVLPFVKMRPMAVANPIWIRRGPTTPAVAKP